MTAFYTLSQDLTYIECKGNLAHDVIYLPLNIDSEFQSAKLGSYDSHNHLSQTLTLQVASLAGDGKIYSHPDSKEIARHSLFKSGFIAVDYLVDCKIDCAITNHRNKAFKFFKDYPKLIIRLYAHFAVADIIRIFQGIYQDDVRNLIINPKKQGIRQERRMRTYTQYGQRFLPYCLMPWLLEIDNQSYQVGIEIMDTAGLAGILSYEGLAKITNVELDFKELFSNKDKSKMRDMYLNRQDDFDNYALGDLKVSEIYSNFGDNFLKVYQSLALESFYKMPKLTIGRTVADLFKSSLLNQVKDEKFLKEMTKYANSDYLKRESNSRRYLAKCDGGRVFNNRPLNTIIDKGIVIDISKKIENQDYLVDIDIAGAYGNGLIIQDYPLGIPMSFGYPLSGNSKYLSLGEFLKAYGNQLVAGLWFGRVSTFEKELSKRQDFLISWIVDASKIPELKTDTDNQDTAFKNIEDGSYTRIFTNEITLAVINHDFIQWLDNICSKEQRRELLDNLYMIDAIYYPKDMRVSSIEELKIKNQEFKGLHSSEHKEGDTLIRERYCHSWYSLNLGDLLVKNLILERAKYPKKSPENETYKLIINTLYGDMVSPFFDIGNVIVGNNITARCRAMAWYLEKGLNACQTITDGCVFDINQIAIPARNQRLTSENTCQAYRFFDKENNWNKKVLPTPKAILIEDILTDTNGVDYSQKTNRITKEGLKNFIELSGINNIENIPFRVLYHLKNLFPNVDVLHKEIINEKSEKQIGIYRLEVKCIAFKGIFHGTANYALKEVYQYDNSNPINPYKKIDDIYKMRGYKNKMCYSISELDIEDDSLEDIEESFFTEDIEQSAINVPETFFNNLLNNPLNRLPRMKPFTQEKIIKCNEYRENYHSRFKDSQLEIGYSYQYARLISELSIRQFTFKNHKNFKKWLNSHNKNKLKYNQGYEALFLNKDSTLDYARMLKNIDDAIKNDKSLILKGIPHPFHIEKDKIKNELYENYLSE